MNKSELISKVAGTLRLPTAVARTQAAAEVVDFIFGELKASLVANEEVVLPGLGKLIPVTRKARVSRNPRSGEAITVPAQASVRFKPSTVLKADLN